MAAKKKLANILNFREGYSQPKKKFPISTGSIIQELAHLLSPPLPIQGQQSQQTNSCFKRHHVVEDWSSPQIHANRSQR